ncbi:MAG: hypothetical protein JSU82_02225 [Rhodospirillales bacterium]|nr:MAG: hypothetical protein JSU82_02225 [Rhodospirillales bacterium]
MTAMRYAVLVIGLGCGLSAPMAAAGQSDSSCAELATQRAERQYREEDAAHRDRQAGLLQDSELQRDLLRLDAETYRRKVYRDCLERRGAAPPPGRTPPDGR